MTCNASRHVTVPVMSLDHHLTSPHLLVVKSVVRPEKFHPKTKFPDVRENWIWR